MTDKTVAELTAATTPLTGAESFYVVQSGADRKATMADVLEYIGVVVDGAGEGTVTSVNAIEPVAGDVSINAAQIPVTATAVNITPGAATVNDWLEAIDEALDAPDGAALNSENLSGLTDKATARINMGVSLPSPQGRLTLTAGVPVLSSDVTAATSIYYSPLIGQLVPVYSGTEWVVKSILSSTTDTTGLTLALDSNSGHTGYHVSGSLFDLFAAVVSGTLYFGTGPAWTSTTARGSGAATTELEMFSGVWVNKQSMTLRHGSASGNTVTVPARQGTYLGTFAASANGQTEMTFKPSAAAGGTANKLYLWNGYNQVPMHAICRDSTDTWTYATSTIRSANNSTSNRVGFVLGLGGGRVSGRYCAYSRWSASTGAIVGVGYDSTTAFMDQNFPNFLDINGASVVDAFPMVSPFDMQTSDIGFHYVQALEWANTASTVTFFGDNALPTLIQMGLSATVYG
jgi:hypothetical protein